MLLSMDNNQNICKIYDKACILTRADNQSKIQANKFLSLLRMISGRAGRSLYHKDDLMAIRLLAGRHQVSGEEKASSNLSTDMFKCGTAHCQGRRAGRSAGRSLPWHGRGLGFKSRPVHFNCFYAIQYLGHLHHDKSCQKQKVFLTPESSR